MDLNVVNRDTIGMSTNINGNVYNISDNNGANISGDSCISNKAPNKSTTNSDTISEDININDSINIPVGIYRYKFTNEFTQELFKFSKIHQYDHRKDFKEAWENWMEENSDIIDGEVRRISNLGYDGDIIDKMFKSARYYFRKKSTEKKEPAKRRIYVGSQKDLLEAMDEHIKANIISGDFKPSNGFDEFCKENVSLLREQVNLLVNSGITDSNEVKAKIKKTYKNRYFLMVNK